MRENVLAVVVFDGDWLQKLFGFLADFVLPNDFSGIGIECDHETSTGATLVFGVERIGMLITSTANDDFSISKNGRRIENVDRVMIGEALGACIDFPKFLAGDAIECEESRLCFNPYQPGPVLRLSRRIYVK